MDEHNDWLDNAFEPFRHENRPRDWAGIEEVQRRSTRRRRRRLAATSGGVSVALAAVLVVGFVSFGSRGRTPGSLPESSGAIQRLAGPNGSVHLVADVKVSAVLGTRASEEALAAAEERFALQLTRAEASGTPTGNVLLSPMSAHIDLAMLELGAAGATAQEIATALQSSGLSADTQAAAWNGLLQSLLAGETAGELHVANSIWVRDGLSVEARFLRETAETFGNNTYEADFESNSAEQAINAWVAEETAGRIKVLYQPGDLAASTEVVLANALHFHAAWQKDLFGQAVVEHQPFYPSSGSSVSVPMVVDSQDALSFAQGTGYDAVQLPYTNGRFAALLIEPTGGSIGSLLATLDPAGLSGIVRALHSGFISFSMPELTLSARRSLDEPLSSMGMAQAFNSADFSPMLGQLLGATNQQVGGVEQAVTLDVNKWGTDAAAATGVSVQPSDAHSTTATIAFDHPYLFLIRDTVTGTILFSSVVNNPAGA